MESQIVVDYQLLFNIVFALASVMGGWILGRITRSLDNLDRDVRALPQNYVSKADYRNDIGDIKEALRRIEDKLDHKVDK